METIKGSVVVVIKAEKEGKSDEEWWSNKEC
jgi:hypothetical protein